MWDQCRGRKSLFFSTFLSASVWGGTISRTCARDLMTVDDVLYWQLITGGLLSGKLYRYNSSDWTADTRGLLLVTRVILLFGQVGHVKPPPRICSQCCQIGRFSAQLGYFCLRQAGKKYIGRVNTIWAAFVHIWRVFNIVKTALSLF